MARTTAADLSTVALLPGVLIGAIAMNMYPPLDFVRVTALGLCLFGVPFFTQVVGAVMQADRSRFRKMNLGFGAAILLLGLAVFLNGVLDKSTPRGVRVTVIYKQRDKQAGREVRSYLLTIQSLRDSNYSQRFDVDLDTYRRVQIGQWVTVQVHDGFFGLPWYGAVFAP